jgi:hypothetical protein
MNWTVAATFDNAVTAEMAKNLLESQGVPVMLSDEETVATAWNLSNAVGGIKLHVPVEALGRAEYLLEHKAAPPRTDEEIADAIAATPEAALAAAGPGPIEPFDDTATDIEVDKVLKATVFALLFFPAQLYTLYRLWMLRYADPPVREKDRWKVRLAYALSLPLWFAVIVPAALILGYFDPGPQGQWRNQRFTGIGDAALTIDLPGEYGYGQHDVQTALGPAKNRAFGVNVGNQNYYVQLMNLASKTAPADPAKALKEYVEAKYPGPGFRIASLEPGKLSGHSKVDTVVEYTDGVTERPRIWRETVAIVGPHVVSLAADLPEGERQSRIADRFFRSARIE